MGAGNSLDRFVTAQADVIETAMAELAAGRKASHWMWFVFPQLRWLGSSDRALFYGIADAAEARAYLAHPTLGPRLHAAVEMANTAPATDAEALFGAVDALKYRSCLTLFAAVAPEARCFAEGLGRFYGGEPCRRTLGILARQVD